MLRIGVSFPPTRQRRLSVRLLEGKVHHVLQGIFDPQLLTISRDAVPAASSANYIGLANVRSNTGELVETSDSPQGNCFRFIEDDVLFGRLRPYLNKVHRAEEGGVCSTEFHVIRIRPSDNVEDEVLPGYLATILRSSLMLAQVKHMTTGNTHPRLANEDVVNLVVPVPDIETQQEIASERLRREQESRRLKAEAKAGWEAAKAKFERELLDGKG